MELNLKGKRIIVTGASKGIGRAIAQALLAEGARLAICARDPSQLEEAAAALSKHGEVHHQVADMSQDGAPADFASWAAQTLGGLDIVVSNVSAMSNSFRECVETDILGVQSLLRESLKHMADHSGANIICISSRAASMGMPRLQSYATVKAATISMVKSLAMELGPRGIRVNAVSPGDIFFPGGGWDVIRQHKPTWYKTALAENPYGRLGKPEEVADVVTFIASDRASFISGANILVDGAATTGLQI